jgi:hypothetical protein
MIDGLHIRLRAPFRDWERYALSGEMPERRRQADLFAAHISALVAPQIDRGLSDMLLYGVAYVRIDPEMNQEFRETSRTS